MIGNGRVYDFFSIAFKIWNESVKVILEGRFWCYMYPDYFILSNNIFLS